MELVDIYLESASALAESESHSLQAPMIYYLNENLLELLEKDPNQFHNVYQGEFAPAIPPEQHARQELGRNFHQIMRQCLMGLPVEPLLVAHPQIKCWVEQLQQHAPEIFEEQPGWSRSWDEQIQVAFGESLMNDNSPLIVLSSIYDLIVRGHDSARIIDWTTSTVSPDYLQNCWNTRLKLFLLAANSTYLTEDISLTYWLLAENKRPHFIKIGCNREQHQAVKDRLRNILLQLEELSESPAKSQPFPDPLDKFLRGQIGAEEYLASITEVEI